MATNNVNRSIPYKAVHPGMILDSELSERGISQKDFAKRIGVQPSHLNAFIKGKRDMTADLAFKLEAALGIPANMWMDLHMTYLSDCRAIESRDSEEQRCSSYEIHIEGIVNIKLLYKCLAIQSVTAAKRVASLFEKLKAANIEDPLNRALSPGYFKHSEKLNIDERNLKTWLLINYGTIINADKPKGYVPGNAIIVAKEISEMANACTLTVPKIKEALSMSGICYLEVGKIDKVPVDAYSTIYEGYPVITVTYRYNDIDKLAFDILHELCHIDKHIDANDRAFISIEGADYNNDPKEKEANDFAKDMLISPSIWKSILRSKTSSLSMDNVIKSIASAAIKYGISPSIAVARYKHDSKYYRTHLYRSPKIKMD